MHGLNSEEHIDQGSVMKRFRTACLSLVAATFCLLLWPGPTFVGLFGTSAPDCCSERQFV